MIRRYCFFGGKGGTGKTSLSSSWALKLARSGRKVLAVSTDPAHSLADAFGKAIGKQIVQLEPNLWAVEVDAAAAAQKYVAGIEASMTSLVSPAIVEDLRQQLRVSASSPGAEESALFDAFVDLMELADPSSESKKFETVVFDTAPTGHTLRLLELPELLGFWMSRLMEKRNQAMSLMRLAAAYEEDLASKVGDDPIYRILSRRRERFEWARERLTDKESTAFHIVLNAERMPILETERALQQLEKFGIPVGAFCVNRVIPEEAGEFFARHRGRQTECLKTIQEKFGGRGVLQIPWLDGDVQGVAELERIIPYLENLE